MTFGRYLQLESELAASEDRVLALASMNVEAAKVVRAGATTIRALEQQVDGLSVRYTLASDGRRIAEGRVEALVAENAALRQRLSDALSLAQRRSR